MIGYAINTHALASPFGRGAPVRTLGRMMMCRGAAEMLGCKFRLTVNGGKVL